METLQKRSLFWDIDPKTIDLEQHKRFIMERILARGDVEDIHWAQKLYGNGPLKETLLKAKTIDPKSLSFWCHYFNLDRELCIRKPSLLKRAAFWKR